MMSAGSKKINRKERMCNENFKIQILCEYNYKINLIEHLRIKWMSGRSHIVYYDFVCTPETI